MLPAGACEVRLFALKKHSGLEVAERLSISGFWLALIGLFVFGNYLMIAGHRPHHEVLSSGYTYPIPGKGGNVYLSMIDLISLASLIAVVVISMVCANWAHRKRMG